jgi:N-acetylmuramoyl-L-alanine amidase
MMRALRKFVVLPKWGGGKLVLPPYKWWCAPSKSYNRREYGPVDTIVIHATAGSSSSGAMSVTNAGTASWHWLVPDENESAHGHYAHRCVADEKKAWHVLRTVRFPCAYQGMELRNPGHTDINSRAYGIEIVNAQTGRDPFSDWQLRITAQIVNYHRSLHPDIGMYLTTHAYLDPSRKLDPGEQFTWDLFLKYIMEGEQPMPEVPDMDEWAAPAVAAVKDAGIMTGYPDGTFRGREPVSRQELASVIARLLTRMAENAPVA